MKRITTFLLFLALALSLCGCGREEPVAEVTTTAAETAFATEAPTEAPGDVVLEAFRQVVSGESVFIDTYSGAPLSFDPQTGILEDNYGSRVVPIKFTLLDLDQDDVPELVLGMREGTDIWRGFWVLKVRDNTVFGYELTYRNFADLKEDGTMRFEFGRDTSSKSGLGRMIFSDNSWSAQFTAAEIVSQDENEEVVFTHELDGQEVSSEEFLEVYTKHDEKPDAMWYAFSEENLAREGIGDAEYCDSGKMVDILGKNGVFYDRSSKMYLSLRDFEVLESARAEAEVALTRVTAMDLNGDGEKEAVLWITKNGEDAGALFLHNNHGVVQGLAFDYSMFNCLKADGTILWGGSEKYYGASRVILEDPYQYQDDIHRYHDYGDGIDILVNGTPGNEASFLKAMEAERAKPDAEWAPFPCENPEALLK